MIVASSVDANPQNYTNVFYNKFIELAQQYSDNAFDFQFFPSMQLGDEQETRRGIQLAPSTSPTCHLQQLCPPRRAFRVGVNASTCSTPLKNSAPSWTPCGSGTTNGPSREGGCRLLRILTSATAS